MFITTSVYDERLDFGKCNCACVKQVSLQSISYSATFA